MIATGGAEKAMLEQYKIALTNVDQPEIAAAMALYGYGTEKITEGRNLLVSTNTVYNSIFEERHDEAESYALYAALHEEIVDTYRIHRRLAKVMFKDDSVAMSALDLTGETPQAYIKWLSTVSAFYRGVLSNPVYIAKMALLNITQEVLTATQAKVAQMEAARAKYQLEKGESQATTKAKDRAFGEMDDWMADFFAVARVALYNRPQLLVALDKFVRS